MLPEQNDSEREKTEVVLDFVLALLQVAFKVNQARAKAEEAKAKAAAQAPQAASAPAQAPQAAAAPAQAVERKNYQANRRPQESTGRVSCFTVGVGISGILLLGSLLLGPVINNMVAPNPASDAGDQPTPYNLRLTPTRADKLLATATATAPAPRDELNCVVIGPDLPTLSNAAAKLIERYPTEGEFQTIAMENGILVFKDSNDKLNALVQPGQQICTEFLIPGPIPTATSPQDGVQIGPDGFPVLRPEWLVAPTSTPGGG